MGTQAYWMSAKYRYRRPDDLGWTYAPTLADVREDTRGETVEIQVRTGRRSENYVYVPYPRG